MKKKIRIYKYIYSYIYIRIYIFLYILALEYINTCIKILKCMNRRSLMLQQVKDLALSLQWLGSLCKPILEDFILESFENACKYISKVSDEM